jgi:fibronectin type 3 domain-containing protein
MRRSSPVFGVVAGLVLLAALAARANAATGPIRTSWPPVQEQLTSSHVRPGSALEKLILENQDFSTLRPQELNDRLRLPPWLRVLYRKNHPDAVFSGRDATGGYPLVLHEVYEWMLSHQNLLPGAPDHGGVNTKSASETGEMDISGNPGAPRSESMIRINFNNPSHIIGASNNISASGQQAMFFSTNTGATWGQTSLSLQTGDSFHSDPTVEWTSDGTAWSTTIGINASATVLKLRNYKSTNNGATWTFDATFSGSETQTDKEMLWADHSATSPFKDNIYAIWHNGLPALVAHRTGPAGSWTTPIQVSGSETTGTAIGADIKSDSAGNVYAFWPDTGSQGIYVAKSTNGGSSFAAPIHIATTFESFQLALPADNSRFALIYTTADTYVNGGTNNVYVAWDDLSGDAGCNSVGSDPGGNVNSTCKTRIWLARSTNGGATWSAPVKINNQSGLNDQFFPWLAVDPTSGKVSITYYDTVGNSSRTQTNMWYQSSTDGGVTWSTPFKVTTATTDETTAGADSGNQYGDYTGLSGWSGTFFPCWTDRRGGGNEQIWSANIADGTTCTPPAAPTGVTATANGQTAINVSWTASTGATSYTILRSTTSGGPYTQVGTSTTTSFADSGLTCNTAYFYVVTASNGTCASGNSAQATATTATCTCTPPAAPTGVTATANGQTAANISWTASTGATSYTILRSTTSGGPYTQVGTSTTTSFADSGLTCNTAYFYVVTASNGTCSSGNSAQATTTTAACTCTPPAAPTGVTATANGQTAANVSWTASTGATSYAILRSTTSGGPYTQVGTSTTTSFADSGLTCNTTYYYVVTASNGTCSSGNSAQAAATTAACSGCTTTTLYSNTFESGSGLSDWTKGSFNGGSTTDWRGIQSCTAHSGTHIFRFGGSSCSTNYGNNRFAFAQPQGATGIAVPSTGTKSRLSFWHHWNFETSYDGATLTVSVDGVNYFFVPASAILSGSSYNNTINAACPPVGAAGASSFSGSQSSFVNTVVDLDAACNAATGLTTGCAGRSVRIGFTAISDCSVTFPGWFLDDVTVTDCQ